MLGRKMDTTPRQTALVVRIAWLATFVVPLTLATLLLAARAQSAPAPAATVPFALEELEAEEEGEYEETECDFAWEELEEGLLTESDVEELCEEIEARAGKASSATECPLRSTRAHASVRNDNLKVTVGYSTFEPVKATIKVRNGSARDTYKRKLGKSGVLRFTEPLGDKSAKKRTEVRIKLPKGGTRCPSQRLVLFPK